LVRNFPDDVVKSDDARATEFGAPLDVSVRDVLLGEPPLMLPVARNQKNLAELTKRHSSRFEHPLPPLARKDFREGMEETTILSSMDPSL
jgi:hypothetical protein